MGLQQLLAQRVRELREEKRRTQDALAARARENWGLPWTSATVSHIENGSRSLSVEEFVLLPLILGAEITEVVPGDEPIALSGETSMSGAKVLQVLSGHGLKLKVSDIDSPQTRSLIAAAPKASRALQQTLRRAKRLWPEAQTLDDYIAADKAAEGVAEHKAATKLRTVLRLDVKPRDVSLVAFSLWGRGLSDERDRRLSERVEDDVSPSTRQALRGHVTRALLKELEPVIAQRLKRGR